MPTAKSYSQHTQTTTWNPVKRNKPRVNVVRGYGGNETSALSRSLPIKDGVTIRSGQLITTEVVNGEDQWILSKAGGIAAAGNAYIAYHDGSDPDVVSCGKLLGFDLNGDYHIETGYFDQGNTAPAQGSALVASSTPGSLTVDGSNKDPGGVVLGYVRGVKTDLSQGQYNANVKNMAQNTEAAPADSVVVGFVTA